MLHLLLRRQLERCRGSEEEAPREPGWHEFLERVSNAYAQADDERNLQDRMMVTLSAEMLKLNESLRASETRLCEERDMLQAVFTSLGEGLCVLDPEARCQYLNPEGARLMGGRTADFVGRSMRELCAEVQAHSISAGTLVRNDDALFMRLDRTTFQAAFVLNPILRDGGVRGSVLVFRDITERRRLEAELRQAQKLESVGRLAAGVAHEINTPVQFVSDSVQFLRDAFNDMAGLLPRYGVLRAAVQEDRATPTLAEEIARTEEEVDLPYLIEHVPKALERSVDGLSRVATIVRSMKSFAHPEQKEMAPIDLNQAIKSTLTIARFEYKYVAELETDLGELPSVICLAGEMNQVILNIVVNAAHAIADVVKGTEAKGRITVRTRRDGDDALISISDTGGGIPESIRERIFDPFFTTKEVGRGTGQGLAIARSVVRERHGGQLTFETEMGKGTTFIIRIPLAGTSKAAAQRAA